MSKSATPLVMKKTDWPRVFLCGLVAGGVWALLCATLFTLAGGDFLAAVREAPQGPGVPRGGLYLFLHISNVAAGLWAMWLYSAIRPRSGPGPRAAVWAGLAWWVIVSLQSGNWVALLAIPPAAVLILLAGTLPAMIVATLVGAWFYER